MVEECYGLAHNNDSDDLAGLPNEYNGDVGKVANGINEFFHRVSGHIPHHLMVVFWKPLTPVTI